MSNNRDLVESKVLTHNIELCQSFIAAIDHLDKAQQYTDSDNVVMANRALLSAIFEKVTKVYDSTMWEFTERELPEEYYQFFKESIASLLVNEPPVSH